MKTFSHQATHRRSPRNLVARPLLRGSASLSLPVVSHDDPLILAWSLPTLPNRQQSHPLTHFRQSRRPFPDDNMLSDRRHLQVAILLIHLLHSGKVSQDRVLPLIPQLSVHRRLSIHRRPPLRPLTIRMNRPSRLAHDQYPQVHIHRILMGPRRLLCGQHFARC